MNPETLLMRQIHPNFLVNGKITSQAFFPSKKDENQLSMYDGTLFTAQESHAHFTSGGYLSVAVYGVVPSEVNEIGLESRPHEEGYFSGHVIIDFASASEKAARKFAKSLRACAEKRGVLYTA
jgi:hypothetical protein